MGEGVSPERLVRLGVRNLLVHRLRSGLSILGVLFGVAAVVAMSSVGEGARREALAEVGALGIDTVTLRLPARGAGLPGGQGLRLRDADSVLGVGPGLSSVAPVREAVLSTNAPGGRTTDVTVLGTTPGYGRAAHLSLALGRFLTDVDVRDQKRVAVLGAGLAAALFPLGNPCRERVRLGEDWFDVVGVLESRVTTKGRGGPIRARDINRVVLVPLLSLDHGANPRADGIDEIVLGVQDPDAVTSTAELAKRVVARASTERDLDVVVPREILRQRERTQKIFDVVTGAVAAIGLVVGGIGIMNIMLASVAERTREVGVRRALGAARRDIALQFLVESSLLTAGGGVLGVLLGILGSFAIEAMAGWPTALSLQILFVSLAMALGVGVGFGFYPAWKAAHLEPMEALRLE
jgi:putative ABC transport system permease protein